MGTVTGPVDLSGQEQVDANAATGTPESEAREPTNDSQVTLLPPPPSGAGGSYPAQELSSGAQRLNGISTPYDYDVVTSTRAPGYGSGGA